MSKRTRLLIRYLLFGVVAWLLFVVLFDRAVRLSWVGHTDLTVEFVVTDAETGQPIEGAGILILSGGGFYEDGRRLRETGRTEEELRFTTDQSGVVSYVCRDSMCFGTESGLRLTNTYRVHLPWWVVTVAAPGYVPTEPFHLNESLFWRAVERIGPQQAKLVVPIALRKSQP